MILPSCVPTKIKKLTEVTLTTRPFVKFPSLCASPSHLLSLVPSSPETCLWWASVIYQICFLFCPDPVILFLSPREVAMKQGARVRDETAVWTEACSPLGPPLPPTMQLFPQTLS